MSYTPLPCTADLPAHAPAFVRAPSFVFVHRTAEPSRSELLRRQIDSAQASRSRI